MKKIFIEPKMKRIELNIKENIASSSVKQTIDCQVADMVSCTITNTQWNILSVPPGDVTAVLAQCTVTVIGSEETDVPVEEAMKYMGW